MGYFTFFCNKIFLQFCWICLCHPFTSSRIQNMHRSRHGRREDDERTKMSKFIAYALRHGGRELGLPIDQEGFCPVSELLYHPQLSGKTEMDIERLVMACEKQRYAMRRNPARGDRLEIRANQGHSIQVKKLDLEPIKDPTTQCPLAVHGTKLSLWEEIKTTGLSKMGRNHIHMASGLPKDEETIISGMRVSSSLAIYVDVVKAMKDGIEFYLSANNVILSPGNEQGVIPKEYFLRASNLKKNIDLPL